MAVFFAKMLFVLCIWSLTQTVAASGSSVLNARPHLREITVADGLPSSNITAITEDMDGYLWLASKDGLARFDGQGYRVWRAEDGLGDNNLWSLHVDSRNQLWIGTRNAGLLRMSSDRQDVTSINQSSHPQLRSNTIFSVTSTPDGSIWFGTDTAGLYRLSNDGKLQQFMPRQGDPASLPSPCVGQLTVDGQGVLWVGTTSGVARWTGNGFEGVELGELSRSRVNSLTLDRSGRMWIGTPDGLARHGANGDVQIVKTLGSQDSTPLRLILHDRQGDYWFDTAAGIMHQRDGGAAELVELFSAVPQGALKRTVSLGHEDRDGGLWMSMLDGGLWQLPGNWRQFVQIAGMRSSAQGSHNPLVFGTAHSRRGGLWLVGTGGDLDYLDPERQQIRHHLSSKPGSLWMRSVLEDGRGQVWIGRYGLLERYDPVTKRLQSWSIDSAADPAMHGALSKMILCEHDRIWIIGGEGGLQQRDQDGHLLWRDVPAEGGTTANAALYLVCGPDGVPWLGTRNGVMRWDAATKHFLPIAGSPITSIHNILLADGGGVWLGQMGALSLFRWNGKALEKVTEFGRREGFPAIEPLGIALDGQGQLWVATSRGLLRIDPDSRIMRNFGVHDGLRSQEFIHRTLTTLPDGKLVAATDYGLVMVDPEQIRPTQRSIPLVIDRVSMRMGERVDDVTHLSSMVFAHDMRDLQVSARLLTFLDAARTSYRFKLVNYDSDWVDVGPSGQRLFPRLSPGTYELHVQARTPDHQLTPVRTLRFHVESPWWWSSVSQSVYLLLLLAAVMAGLTLYRRRITRQGERAMARTRHEWAVQTSEAKTRFLATFGHEVRTPLTGVLGMSELLLAAHLPAREHSYAGAIQSAGTHLLRLVNDALDLARIEAGKLELRQDNIDLQALLDGVMALMTPLATTKGLSLRLNTVFADHVTVVGDELRLRQIVLNLVSNAIKFTASGSVSLTVGLGGGRQGIWLEINDTGPGLSQAQQQRLFERFSQVDGVMTEQRYGSSGLGLAISQELASALGGKISVASQLGCGACFRVDLPLSWSIASTQHVPQTVVDCPEGLQILVVEDDPTIAEVVCSLLRQQGQTVVHAPHALAALAELDGAPFDIVLLDLDLPGMDGISLAQQINAMGVSVPLLAVTARSDSETEPRVRAVGMHGFLRKPVTGELLASAIHAARNNWLSQRQEQNRDVGELV